MLQTPISRAIRGRLSASRLEAIASVSGGIRSSIRTYDNKSCRNESLWPDPLLPRIRQGIAGIHVSARPQMLGSAVSLQPTSFRSAASELSSLSRRRIQKRWMSSTNKEGSTDEAKKPISKEAASGKKQPESEQVASDQEPGRLSSIMDSVGPTLRKVTEWNVGDLVSVYAIVLLIVLIIFSPIVVEQMKKADSVYIDLDEYDPVAQMEKIVRYDLFGEEELEKEYEKEVHHDPGRKSIDNTIGMATDVLKSEALQEAIASLITQGLGICAVSECVPATAQESWNDLVNDPRSNSTSCGSAEQCDTKQGDSASTRRLVLQLIKDKEVYDELTRLLVRLGQERGVY